MRIAATREILRGSLWVMPAVGVLVAIALAMVLHEVDENLGGDLPFLFAGGPEGARTFLATIAASMITFTALVFSITIVVLQLASQQFSPRVLRTFLRDRQSQVALAVFVATFTFAVLVLRDVRSQGEGVRPFVPRLSITVTFALVLLSLGAFVAYIHRIAQAVRASTIVDLVGDETREQIDVLMTDHAALTATVPELGEPVHEIRWLGEPGVITHLDLGDLVEAAARANAVLELVPSVGEFMPTGKVLFRVYGGRVEDHAVTHQVSTGRERTMLQDVAFGFRQLVDIAIRALSPAVNDPTTAVQVLDQIHDLLRRLATRPLPSGRLTDARGALRLLVPVPSWESYVSLGLDEIRHNGDHHLQVVRRLRALLEDLRDAAPQDRREPVERRLELLDAALADAFELPHDRVTAATPDPKGLGS